MSDEIDDHLFKSLIIKEATLKQTRKIQVDKYEPAEVEYSLTVFGVRSVSDVNALWAHVENKLEDWEKRKRGERTEEIVETMTKDLDKVTTPPRFTPLPRPKRGEPEK